MAKFYGSIGFTVTEEIYPGVWEPVSTERTYYGDVIKNHSRWQQTGNVNDDITINNQISIVADPFAYNNFFNLRYVEWLGTKWKVTNIDVQRPRLILTIGGVYNE